MFSYKSALSVAQEFIATIHSSCEKIEIVGSLRRERTKVNDIDLIVIPAFIVSTDQSLFEEPIRHSLLEERLSELCTSGQVLMKTNGPKVKRVLKRTRNGTVPIDIYIADESTWWTLLLIRTGSRQHNIRLARRAIEKHMVLKADGTGLLTAGGDIIPIHTEQDVFKHLGLAYRLPEERE